ncbi:MAG: HD domain-containing protein [Dehalobacter sp. 4CP]|uniref:DVU_1551 family NTP transferase n=1 Tax=Dehalobacter sp. CP TaxID=2594474 RepID=UPI0013C5B7F8|nr:NTP transferase domain-containing protein [Dehalobacter sp.]NBJ15940.1 HD domain-containing protein [Dehalobacter sp. 4CP]
MKNTSIAAIIAAGGYSSRMGSFKPFLKFGKKSAIEMLIDTYKGCGIDNIIVVTGYKGSEVAEKLRESGATCLQNENYSEGMFTSVIKGVKALDTRVSAFFMQPVDIPLVKKHTIELLKKKYLEGGKGIIYPDFCGRVGHPPLIHCKYREVILRSNGEGGLKKILKEYSSDSIYVHVFDKTVLMDMDTKEDYEKLLGYFNAGAPDGEECSSILDIYKVPENIIRHCRKVSEVSVEISRSLNNAGYELNECALKAAAMLHDIAKKEENHARVGGKILQEIGYGKVGSIIGSHTDIEVDGQGRITESEILYLADKLVREDKVISIEERFKQSLNKYQDNPEVLRKIENRRDAAYKIIKKIEAVTGRGFNYG